MKPWFLAIVLVAGCTSPSVDVEGDPCAEGYWPGCDGNPDAIMLRDTYGLYQLTNTSTHKEATVADGVVYWTEPAASTVVTSNHIQRPGEPEAAIHLPDEFVTLSSDPLFDDGVAIIGYGQDVPDDSDRHFTYYTWDGEHQEILPVAPHKRPSEMGGGWYITVHGKPDKRALVAVNLETEETVELENLEDWARQPNTMVRYFMEGTTLWTNTIAKNGDLRLFEYNVTTGERTWHHAAWDRVWLYDANDDYLVMSLSGRRDHPAGVYLHARHNNTSWLTNMTGGLSFPSLGGQWIAHVTYPEGVRSAIMARHIPTGEERLIVHGDRGIGTHFIDGDEQGFVLRISTNKAPSTTYRGPIQYPSSPSSQLYWYPLDAQS